MSLTTRAAVDVHAHVFAPGLRTAPNARYVPEYAATVADYLAVLDEVGCERGVLVQPSFLGTDNGYLLDALRARPDRLSGIVVVGEDEPDLPSPETLREWDDLGVRGIRLNLVGRAVPDLRTTPWGAAWAQLGRLGWHVEIQADPQQWAALAPVVADLDVPVLIDHLGLPEATGGADVLALAARDHVWITASGAYRSGEGAAERMLRSLAGAGLTDRLLIGTDWPHTRHEDVDTAACLDRLLDALPASCHRAVLVDNPRRLYRF